MIAETIISVTQAQHEALRKIALAAGVAMRDVVNAFAHLCQDDLIQVGHQVTSGMTCGMSAEEIKEASEKLSKLAREMQHQRWKEHSPRIALMAILLEAFGDETGRKRARGRLKRAGCWTIDESEEIDHIQIRNRGPPRFQAGSSRSLRVISFTVTRPLSSVVWHCFDTKSI